jgi:hypothetical protein
LLRRIEIEERAATARASPHGEPIEAAVPAAAEADLETARLPLDHPRWVRDAIAVSARARELVARLKPVVVAAMSLWDHRLRSIIVGGRRVEVDPSGSYRADA